jgi:hypothetical protein
VSVDPGHISRLLGNTVAGVSRDLLLRVANAFDVAPEFFLEYRQWRISDALRSDPALCDRLYGELSAEAIAPEPTSKDAAACFAAAALLSATEEADRPAPANGRFSRDQIIAAIIRWNSRYGEPPKSIDWDPSRARRKGQTWRAERFDGDHWPTLAIVRRQFGTMSDALHAAGLRPRPRPVRPRGRILTREDILHAIREWHRLYGEPPAMSDWAPARARRLGHEWRAQRYLAGDWPHLSTVLKRFETFGTAVKAAGLEPRPRGRHTRTGPGLHVDTRALVSAQLAAAEAPCGPAVLASRVRAVAQSRSSADPKALRGALIDLAAAALSWADAVGTINADRAAA